MPSDTMWERYQQRGQAHIEMALRSFFKIDKTIDLDDDHDEGPFRCITFMNGIAAKQSQQTARDGGNKYFQL